MDKEVSTDVAGTEAAGAEAESSTQTQGQEAEQATQAQAGAEAEKSGTTLLSDNANEAKETPAVPESYEFTLPEGVTLSDNQKSAFAADAKELGLSQEQANKMLALSQKHQQAGLEAHQTQVKAWGEEVKADKELGGKNFEATDMYATDGLRRFDTGGQLETMLKETGYCYNPAVVRFLSALGKAHAEDKLHTGKNAVEDKPLEDRLYK